MANRETGVTFVIRSEDRTKEGINQAQSSFDQFKSSLDQLLGGKLSTLSDLLSNPFTLGATAIAGATNALKELTSAGMDGQDRFLKFSAMLGSQGDANTLIGKISELSDTSFESRDAIEQMALKFVGAGKSAEEVTNIMSAIIDVSNTSGRSIGEVGNAFEQAFNGRTTQIEKMVPSLKELEDGAWQSGEAIKHIGDELHEASIQIANGSLSNQLGALGNSWQQIKENLGQSIVLKIQGSGALDTISRWLEKIEKNTQEAVHDRLVNNAYDALKSGGDLKTFGYDIALEAYNKLSGEIWNTYKQSGSENIAMPYSLTQSDPNFAKFWDSLTLTQRSQYTQWSTDASSLSNWEQTFLPMLSDEQQKLYSDVQGKIHGLATDDTWVKAQAFNKEMDKYWSAVQATIPVINDTLEGMGAEGEPTSTTPIVKETITAWDRLWGDDTFFYNKVTGQIEQNQGSLIKINEGNWANVTEADFNRAISALSSLEGDKQEAMAKWLGDKYTAYLNYNLPVPVEEDHTGMVFDPVLNRWKNSFTVGNRNQQYAYDLQFQTPVDTAEHLWSSYSSGNIDFDEMMDVATKNGIDLTNHLDEINEINQAREDERFNKQIDKWTTTLSAIGTLSMSLKDGLGWDDTGTILNTAGSLIGGKWGAILGLVGMGADILVNLFSKDDSKVTTADDSVASQVAQYTGSQIIRIQNNFDGAYIVGAGGMSEFVGIIRDELQNLGNLNR